MADTHRLEPEELERIFATSVRPWLFDDATATPEPLAVLVGGQPGAGKTYAARAIQLEADQPLVRIIGDQLRRFHPAYEPLLLTNPEAMPAATARASAAWTERAIDYAREHRVSVLVEGTLRRRDVTLATAQAFHDAGFRVEAHVLAVSPAVSLAATRLRYEGDRARGVGRYTPPAAHEAAVAGLGGDGGGARRRERSGRPPGRQDARRGFAGRATHLGGTRVDRARAPELRVGVSAAATGARARYRRRTRLWDLKRPTLLSGWPIRTTAGAYESARVRGASARRLDRPASPC